MNACTTYVMAFDVADDQRRVRLSRLLESRGTRVQWSVFEILATPDGIAALLREATAPELFDPSQDNLRCYRLCGTCQRLATAVGVGPQPVTPGRPLVL